MLYFGFCTGHSAQNLLSLDHFAHALIVANTFAKIHSVTFTIFIIFENICCSFDFGQYVCHYLSPRM